MSRGVRRRGEARRGRKRPLSGVCFGRSRILDCDHESDGTGMAWYGMACHATPRHAMASAMPSHPEGHRRSMKTPISILSRKKKTDPLSGNLEPLHSFLHIPIIYFSPDSFFWSCLRPYRAVASFPTRTGYSLSQTLSYTSPLLSPPICSVPVSASLHLLHGRYISLLSSSFAPSPRYEPPIFTLRSPHHRCNLSFMASSSNSSLVFKTSPPDHDHSTSHHFLATPVSLQGYGSFVSLSLSFPFVAQVSPQCPLLQPSVRPNNLKSRPPLFLHWTRRALPYPSQPALPGDRSRPHPRQTMYPLNNTSRAGSATLVHALHSTPQRTLAK
jgi:hypothetical protein